MAKHSFKASISPSSLDNLVDELNAYVDFTLSDNLNRFIRELAKVGIKVANYNIYSIFRANISFTYASINMQEGELIGFSQPIHKQWFDKNGNLNGEYDIDPIAISEFGAGWYASSNPWGIAGMRGSLGDNGNRSVWFWIDANGVKHSSDSDYTINPTRPMYKAYTEMIEKYLSVARKVFG